MYLYEKIVNPLTGRKVKINSKLGKNIIKKYLDNFNNTNQYYPNQLGGDNTSKLHQQYLKDNKATSDNYTKEHLNIEKGHNQHINKLNQQIDHHETTKVDKLRKILRETSNQVKTSQDSYHKSLALKNPGLKCYRSKTRGTCEVETFFTQNKDKGVKEDEDTTKGGDKCKYSNITNRCEADFSKWDKSDNQKFSETVTTLDYDKKNNLFYALEPKTKRQVPFITSQITSDFINKGHGEIR